VIGRYEKGDRFWEIRTDGLSLITRAGRVGTPGTERVLKFPSGDAVQERYHRLTLARVRAGWWLAEPASRPDEAPRPQIAPALHPALEEAALVGLDEAPLLVWADWLTAQGDPRGELIALDVARERGPDRELDRRRKALLTETRIVGMAEPDGLTWKRGLIVAAKVDGDSAPSDEMIDDVFDAPAAVALRRLEVAHAPPTALEALARVPRPRLVELSLSTYEDLDLAGIWSACPALRSVRARASEIRLGGGGDALVELAIEGRCVEAEVTRLLGRLETLTLTQPPGNLLDRLARDPKFAPSLKTLTVPKSPAASKVREARRGTLKVEWRAGS
jgi:uncharacterized protein (TIGR02996 family)